MTKNAKNGLAKDLEFTLKKINDIIRNQLIIDVMLLIQGISFLIHPEEAHKGIIKSLSLAIFFAAISIIIGFVITHGFKRHNFRTIILAFIFTSLSIATYFNAGYLAPAFHYFIALTIVLSGFFNILNSYHLIRLHAAKKSLKSKISTEEHKNQAIQGVATTLENTTKLEAERILSPAVLFSGKVAKFRYGHLFVNLLLIFIGIMMLFFRFSTSAVLIRASGGVLVFSALADLTALLWTHRESAFVHRLTHFSQNHKT